MFAKAKADHVSAKHNTPTSVSNAILGLASNPIT